MTKAFADELSAYKINVNAVAPGYFNTPGARIRLNNPTYYNIIMEFTPLKRLGEGQDIVGPIVFLASETSNFMTGQTIFVDGGRSIL